MSIQEYECREHGRTEVFLRGLNVPQTHSCPGCGKPIPHAVSAPALVHIQGTWNDKANYCRVNPYEQAKAQLHNLDREDQEHNDARPMKITEQMLQVTAREIDKGNKRPDDPMAAPKRANRMARKNRKQNQQT